MMTGISLALLIGTLLGILAAMRHRRGSIRSSPSSRFVAYATPQFWLGLMLIVLFSITLGVLPSGGMMTIALDMSAARGRSIVAGICCCRRLPSGLFYYGVYARLMRSRDA
jgi:peptide/nickel transport system permease protein